MNALVVLALAAAAPPSPELRALLPALQDSVPIVRIQTLNRIADLEEPEDAGAVAVIALALHDPDDEVRFSARHALRYFKTSGPAMFARLEEAIAPPDTTGRANAVAALGHVCSLSDRALPLLESQAADTALVPVLAESFSAVLRVRPEQVDGLLACFERCDPAIRYHVDDALVAAGVRAVPALLRASASADWNLRANAVRALGMIGETDGAVGTALIARVEDPDFRVRASALAALTRLPTEAAHDFLRRRNGRTETLGPPVRSLSLHGSARRPGTNVIAVTAEYVERRKPLSYEVRAEEIVLAREHRLYECDLDRRTVRLRARIPVPDEMCYESWVNLAGWSGDSVVVRMGGAPARGWTGYRLDENTCFAAIDGAGATHVIAAKPPGTRSGERSYEVDVHQDGIDWRTGGGDGVRVFRVDEASAELLPAP